MWSTQTMFIVASSEPVFNTFWIVLFFFFTLHIFAFMVFEDEGMLCNLSWRLFFYQMTDKFVPKYCGVTQAMIKPIYFKALTIYNHICHCFFHFFCDPISSDLWPIFVLRTPVENCWLYKYAECIFVTCIVKYVFLSIVM